MIEVHYMHSLDRMQMGTEIDRKWR